MAKTTRKSSTKKDAPPPFLTADDIPSKGRVKAVIGDSIGLYQRDNGSTSLFVAVLVNGDPFTLSVYCKGPDRIALQKVAGRNLIDWPGKTIELFAKEGSQGGRFVNVYEPGRD